jgi:hypothetical protein
MRLILGLFVCLLASGTLEARSLFHRAQHQRSFGISTRRRLFTSELINDPGTASLNFSTAYDFNGNWTTPTTINYTPYGWQTELSLGFDSVDSLQGTQPNRVTGFSTYMSFTAITAFDIGKNFSWAFAPLVTVMLRNDSGVRVGGSLYASYDFGANTVSGNATWTAATTASTTNPAGLFDMQAGYARKIKKFTPYANMQIERATDVSVQYSVIAGVSYDLNDKLTFDLSSQTFGVNTGSPDQQIVAGVTWNFYRRR